MAARRIPLIRIGLTVIVGSVLASLIMFYVNLGQSFADQSGPDQSTAPRDLLNHFTKDFLFAGTVPTGIFWFGALIMLVGIVRNFIRPAAPRR